MLNKLSAYYIGKVNRHYMRVVAFAVLGAVLGWVLFGELIHAPRVIAPNEPSEVSSGLDADVFTLPKAYPERLRIPAIELDTTFEGSLGLNADQTVEVPDSFEAVGWYKYGPTPGELGPAVILGHVDSYEGPAVFWSLGQLEKGDEIFVERDDGTTATFTVERLERHPQSGFPTAKVYGDLDYAGLRLITCSGTFDKGVQEYSHNLIVFAKLKE